ncbi:MAG: agmatine deiminase family protein [Erythrobacter sp.]
MAIFMPPEWGQQEWLWIGFPHDAREWPDALEQAQEQIAAFANAVADSGQQVRLVVRDAANEVRARSLVSNNVTLERQRYGDIWLRDTGPLIVRDERAPAAHRFQFNGWGGKYLMEGDQTVGSDLAEDADVPVVTLDWILEGGAIDTDGTGLAVTTEQCLLNPNRNPNMSRADIEAALERDLGLTRMLWLGEGLVGDHTDGHVDNLARFVGEAHLTIPQAPDSDDPNAVIYDDAAARATDFGCKVSRIPSAGRYEQDGAIVPASYANFVITNSLVVVPVFGADNDAAAVEALSALFPNRRTIGLPADAILVGGGAFHCTSMQMPAL